MRGFHPNKVFTVGTKALLLEKFHHTGGVHLDQKGMNEGFSPKQGMHCWNESPHSNNLVGVTCSTGTTPARPSTMGVTAQSDTGAARDKDRLLKVVVVRERSIFGWR